MTVAGALMVMGIAASCAAVSTAQEHNHPPRVTIEHPRDNDVLEWDTLVRYAIAVSDEEDGESEYEEIPANEVFLEVRYLPDASPLNRDTVGTTQDPPGLLLMKGTNCFNCHAVNTRVLGPPFSEVARRYENDAASVELLAERVLAGSSGVWGEVRMAPHPEFAAWEVAQMVQWVLDEAGDPHRTYYAGTEGAFRTMRRPDGRADGVYVKIPVTPAFPPEKQYVVDNVTYGSYSRLIFQASSKFWLEDDLSINMELDHPSLSSIWQVADEVDTHRVALMGVGPGGISPLRALAGFREVYPGKHMTIEHVIVQDWTRERWAPTCERLSFPMNTLRRFWPHVMTPSGRIHFAGAYADNLNWGMEAATRSANRVAGEIDEA